MRQTLAIWKHNRLQYPGWLALPSSYERAGFSWRTSNWEDHILTLLLQIGTVELLEAVHELVWRREILLQPISERLESSAASILERVDCQSGTFDGLLVDQVNWVEVREAWRNVALSLVTAARFRFDLSSFEQRVELLKPFLNDHLNVEHRIRHEGRLWALYTVNYGVLDGLLREWIVENAIQCGRFAMRPYCGKRRKTKRLRISLVLQRQFREGCGVMPAWRRGAWHGSVGPVRYCPAYPPATAATLQVRTVPGAAFPAPPGRPAAS